MKKIIAILILFFGITSGRTQCVIQKTSDATFKSYYKNKKLVRVERRNAKNILTSITYYSGEEKMDSLFICDSLGRFWRSRHYSNTILMRQLEYWPNGKVKNYLKITSIDTVELPPDPITQVMEMVNYFNGYMFVYNEQGQLKEEGPISKNEHSGVWIYYSQPGKIERRDTIK